MKRTFGWLTVPPNVGAHTAFPLLGMEIAEFAHDKSGRTRDILAVVDESLVNECAEARQMLWIADITTESRPFGVASFTVPEASAATSMRSTAPTRARDPRAYRRCAPRRELSALSSDQHLSPSNHE